MKRISDVFLICISLFFIFGFGVLIFLKPVSDFSVEERRALETLDGITLGDTLSGRLSARIGDFFCDQFPRRRFTALKANSELTLGRGENNGVVFGKEGYLMIKPSYSDMSLYRENLASITVFCEKYREMGIDTAVFFAPRGVDVLGCYLPDGYADADMSEVWDIAHGEIEGLIEVNDRISALAAAGEYVWFMTDHHWSALGAYSAYSAISERFGRTPTPKDALDGRFVCGGFYGSVYSKSGVSQTLADEIYLYVEDSGLFTAVNYDTGEVRSSLYFYEYAEGQDKYSIFLGGNHGHMGVYSEGERETLLVIKDSFANSALVYLAEDFDLEIYDLRYFSGSISSEIEKISPDGILILYGIDTAVTDGALRRLGW